MSAVCKTRIEIFVIEEFCNLFRDNHRTKRSVSAGDAFGGGDDVGSHVPVVHGEPFARATPSAHDFIRDQKDAILVADFTHTGPVIIRRDDDAVRADDTFHNDCSNLVGTFIFNDFFQMRDTFPFARLRLLPERTAITERVKEVDSAWHGWFYSKTAIVTGQ